MVPESHEEFEIRDLDRHRFEKKAGKSIMELLKEGKNVPKELLKEDELNIALKNQKAKDRQKNKGRLLNPSSEDDDVIYDGKGRRVFDKNGLSVEE